MRSGRERNEVGCGRPRRLQVTGFQTDPALICENRDEQGDVGISHSNTEVDGVREQLRRHSAP